MRADLVELLERSVEVERIELLGILAAAQGNAMAQRQLGVAYAEGLGVRPESGGGNALVGLFGNNRIGTTPASMAASTKTTRAS